MTILHTDEKDTQRIVQLSLDAGTRYTSDVKLTIARISASFVNLARLKETVVRDDNGIPEDPEHISLMSEEMDALVEAWTVFKADQEAKARAEEERVARILAEATQLAASVKTSLPGLEITITADEGGFYENYQTVKVPVFNRYRQVHIDRLLTAVKELIEETDAIIHRYEHMSPEYRASRQPEVLTEIGAQIAAWRAVRPVVPEPEQGISSEDIDTAKSMMEV